MLSSQLSPSFAVLSLLVTLALASKPIPLKWSDQTYGPDGPWHAVHVGLGTPPQNVDLFPGSFPPSYPLFHDYCRNIKSKNACAGGTFDPAASSTAYFQQKNDSAYESGFVFSPTGGFGRFIYINGTNVTTVGDKMTLYNAEGSGSVNVPTAGFDALGQGTKAVVGHVNSTYPQYPLTAGYLSLGYSGDVVAYTVNDSNAYYPIYTYLYKQKEIPSGSFSLHYGSPSLDISPSFYMGGYDRNRVVGDVLVQDISVEAPIPLVEIKRIYLGTAEGPSTFPNAPKSLLKLAGVTAEIQCDINPGSPHLNLPAETCYALSRQLPIKYDSSIGFWLWDTTDPAYKKIMASSSYLAFDIQKPNASTSDPVFPIKIPLQLLDLTLEDPIIHGQKQYFPCMNVPYPGFSYTMGRAFLQAAFFDINWAILPTSKSHWFLAQAPGPNMPAQPDVRSLRGSSDVIQSADFEWAQTWMNYWKNGSTKRGIVALPNKHNGTNSSQPSPSASSSSSGGGLSTGAKAGIGVGVAVGVIAILILVGFFIMRRKRQQRGTQPVPDKAELGEDEMAQTWPADRKDDSRQAELPPNGPQAELGGTVMRQELPSESAQAPVEMPGSQPEPQELANTQTPTEQATSAATISEQATSAATTSEQPTSTSGHTTLGG